MLRNRSIPPSTVIPVLGYPDVDAAAAWLVGAFGFVVRIRIGSHRIQLNVGDGAIVVGEGREPAPADSHTMVRVDSVDRHHARALAYGARVIRVPETHMYGERQYTVEDLAGHRWTFTESVADVDPRSFGATVEDVSDSGAGT